MSVTSRGAFSPSPTPPSKGPESSSALDTAGLDAAVGAVASHAQTWAATRPGERADLLDRVLVDTLTAEDEWLAAACAAKGLAPGSNQAGEELFAGLGTFVRMARLYRDSLRDIERLGRPRYAGPVRSADDGRLVVRVFPDSPFDRVAFPQTTAEVWMQPGVTRQSLDSGQAAAYADPESHAGVSLVLAAGNVASLGPRDALYKLFVQGRVVVMKANPVNDYLVPHWHRALHALVEAGVLRIVTGGADAGHYLATHERIDDVHITGSDKTYDAIVFGSGAEGAARKANDQPVLDKPVTAELGNVSPIIIVPGKWSAAELLYQAEHVATMLVNNAGFNCLAARVVVTWATWDQRDAFLGALTQALASITTRRAYYPGAVDRRDAFVAAHPEAEELGHGPPDAMPWTFIAGVAAGSINDICFTTESFCGQYAETALPASSVADFIDAATAFCNDVIWGTLSATILVHPTSLRDSSVSHAVERAVAELRYGAIGVNVWHTLAFAIGTTTWGAYPGHPRTDIGSGVGVVANACMFAEPQKSVVRGPFRARPKPPWFATASGQYDVMRRFVAFEADPSAAKIPGLLVSVLRP